MKETKCCGYEYKDNVLATYKCKGCNIRNPKLIQKKSTTKNKEVKK